MRRLAVSLAAVIAALITAGPASAETGVHRYSMFDDRIRCAANNEQVVCGSPITWRIAVLWNGRAWATTDRTTAHHRYQPIPAFKSWHYGQNTCQVLATKVACWAGKGQHGFVVDTSSHIRVF